MSSYQCLLRLDAFRLLVTPTKNDAVLRKTCLRRGIAREPCRSYAGYGNVDHRDRLLVVRADGSAKVPKAIIGNRVQAADGSLILSKVRMPFGLKRNRLRGTGAANKVALIENESRRCTVCANESSRGRRLRIYRRCHRRVRAP